MMAKTPNIISSNSSQKSPSSTFSASLVGLAGHQLPELLEFDFARAVFVDLVHRRVQVLVAEVRGNLMEQALQRGARDVAVALNF